MSQLNVLIIEDDARDLVATMIKQAGYNAKSVACEKEAFQALMQNDYDICVINVTSPDIDGWGLLWRIRRNSKTFDIPCIAIGTDCSASAAKWALEAGFTSYLPKPLEHMAFIRHLELQAEAAE